MGDEGCEVMGEEVFGDMKIEGLGGEGPGGGGGKESFIGNLFDDCSGVFVKKNRKGTGFIRGFVGVATKLERKRAKREKKRVEAEKFLPNGENTYRQLSYGQNGALCDGVRSYSEYKEVSGCNAVLGEKRNFPNEADWNQFDGSTLNKKPMFH